MTSRPAGKGAGQRSCPVLAQPDCYMSRRRRTTWHPRKRCGA